MAEETIKSREEKTSDGKSKKGLIIGCIAAAVVVIAAVVALIIINPFKKVSLIGQYDLTGMEVDGEDQSSTISLMKAFGMTASLEIESDTEGKLSIFGDEAKFTYDKNKLHFEKSEDDDESSSIDATDADYTFKDDTITITYTQTKTEDDEDYDDEDSSSSESKTSTEKLIFSKKKDNE